MSGKIHKIIATSLLLIFVGSLYTSILHSQALPKAEAALDTVFCTNCEEEATAAARDAKDKLLQEAVVSNTTGTLGILGTLETKEFWLDGIAYHLAEVALRSITSSIINWINSGFQGSPAFVSDLQGFLLDIADEAAGEFIYGSELGFLCSPFQLDIRIALAIQYDAEKNYAPRCTLTDVSNNIEGFINGSFTENGGWPAWFALTTNEVNHPLGAYFDAKTQMDARIRNAQGQELTLLEWGDGFFSFEACREVKDNAGNNIKDCSMTTPGSVIQDSLSEHLNIGTKRLVVADEIDEIVSALLAQLAQQALTGAAGLLGLGGSSYSSNTHGSSGNLSYLDALVEEDEATQNETILLRLQEASAVYDDYLDLQFEILERSEAVLVRIEQAQNRTDLITGCFDVEPSAKLVRTIAEAETALREVEPLRQELLRLEQAFTNAKTRLDEIAVAEQVLQLERAGKFVTEVDLLQLEGFIDFDLKKEIDELNAEIQQEIIACQIPERNQNSVDQGNSE